LHSLLLLLLLLLLLPDSPRLLLLHLAPLLQAHLSLLSPANPAHLALQHRQLLHLPAHQPHQQPLALL
jgi:hypothetical protein